MKPTYFPQKEEGDVQVLRNMHVVGMIVLQIRDGFSESCKKVKRHTHTHMDGETHNCISAFLNLENFMPYLKHQFTKYIRA